MGSRKPRTPLGCRRTRFAQVLSRQVRAEEGRLTGERFERVLRRAVRTHTGRGDAAADRADVEHALSAELETMASWLGLETGVHTTDPSLS